MAAEKNSPADLVATPELEPGTCIAKKFKVVRRIGQGGMGRVYLARDISMGRDVAVKHLLAHVMRPDFIARFQGESRKLSTVDGHANIVRVHEAGEDPIVGPFFVMEYLDGSNLRALVKSEGPLEVLRGIEIVLAVCSAVRACHRMGVIHRDLKAGNVMVTTDPEGNPLVKVLDFGVAKAISGSPSFGPEITSAGSLVGTPEYMAPEQINAGQVTEKSDQYSIGVLLYFCLTRQLPFQRAVADEVTSSSLHKAIVEGDFLRPRSLRHDIPKEVERIILRAMARDPQDRFPTVHELGLALASLPGMEGRLGHTNWGLYLASARSGEPQPSRVGPSLPSEGRPERRLLLGTAPAPLEMMGMAANPRTGGAASTTSDSAGGTIGELLERRLRERSGTRTPLTVPMGMKPVRSRSRVVLVAVGLLAAGAAAALGPGMFDSWAGGEEPKTGVQTSPEVPPHVPSLVEEGSPLPLAPSAVDPSAARAQGVAVAETFSPPGKQEARRDSSESRAQRRDTGDKAESRPKRGRPAKYLRSVAGPTGVPEGAPAPEAAGGEDAPLPRW